MRFYDGLTFAIIQQPLTRFGMAATLELIEMLSTVFPATLTLPVTACISSISAGLWRAFLTPLDVCKVRHLCLRDGVLCRLEGFELVKMEYKLNYTYILAVRLVFCCYSSQLP